MPIRSKVRGQIMIQNCTATEWNPETGITTRTVFDSEIIYPDKIWDYGFYSIGTFDYYCTIHPFMKGTVIINYTYIFLFTTRLI